MGASEFSLLLHASAPQKLYVKTLEGAISPPVKGVNEGAVCRDACTLPKHFIVCYIVHITCTIYICMQV